MTLATETEQDATTPTAAALLDRVVALRPWLREHQAEAERARRVPQETVERLDDAGVWALTKPARFGGADYSARELHDLYRALAAGDGGTAWVVWATAGGNLWSFAFPDAEMEPLYTAPWVGNRTFALGGTSRRMSGTARRTGGGWIVKGAWPFATGSVHASHGYLAVFLDDTDDANVGMVLVPKDQLVERDDWDVMGLAATGSQTVAVDGELFVPDDRFSTPARLQAAVAAASGRPGGPRRGGLPRSVVLSTGLALGMADHALEVFQGSLGRRSVPYSPYARQLDAPVAHHALGAAAMTIRAAGRVADAAVAELDRMDDEGRDPTAAEVLQLHTDAAWVWSACADAIEELFRFSGASAIVTRMPMQLIARNCRAGSLHAANFVDTWLENLGRSMSGAEAGPSSTSVLERR